MENHGIPMVDRILHNDCNAEDEKENGWFTHIGVFLINKHLNRIGRLLSKMERSHIYGYRVMQMFQDENIQFLVG